jgi:hypothetical protein
MLVSSFRAYSTARPQTTGAELIEAERRIQEEIDEANAAKAALALSQLVRNVFAFARAQPTHSYCSASLSLTSDAACTRLSQSVGFSLEGHPTGVFNGVYRKTSERGGWPVLRNVAGKYCYHHEQTDEWFLNSELTPDIATCFSYIKATEGPLPVGAQAWVCAPSSGAPNAPQRFHDAILKVTVLVRSSRG